MPRPSLDVRRAGVDDVDDLLALWVEAREENSAGFKSLLAGDPEVLRHRLSEALGGTEVHILLARFEQRPAGFVLARCAPVSPLADSTALHIDQLYVTRELRRHGVGRALLSAVAGLAERGGVEQVISSVSPLARDTHRFFARLGFAPLVVRRVVPTAMLRRRLAGESRRRAVDDLLSRRRSLRARARWLSEDVADLPAAPPPTLELPLIEPEVEITEPAEPVGPRNVPGPALA